MQGKREKFSAAFMAKVASAAGHRVDMDYVSCSPFRVPIARLAATQAAVVNR